MNHAKYSFQRFFNASLNLHAKGLFPRDLAFTFSRKASKSSTSSSVLKQSRNNLKSSEIHREHYMAMWRYKSIEVWNGKFETL